MKQNAKNAILAILFLGAFFVVNGQEKDSSIGDAPAIELRPQIARYDYDAIPKDPLASAFFAATIPGSGQIYNKEYLRGFLTGVGFYVGLFLTQVMVTRWEELNTETIYISETEDYPGNPLGRREVFVTKDTLVGLPTGEKVVAVSAALAMAGCWVFSVVDAYRGANRYNQKLMTANNQRKFTIDVAYLPEQEKSRLNLKYRF